MILKYSKLHKIKSVYKILFMFTIQNLIQIGHGDYVVLHALNEETRILMYGQTEVQLVKHRMPRYVNISIFEELAALR
jgi:hypothetical protein